jgi:hypothetical protein
VINIFAEMQISKHKIQLKCSTTFLCCILSTSHFSLLYFFHFPMLYHISSLILPEERTGTAWEHLDQSSFLITLVIIIIKVVPLPFLFLHTSYTYRLTHWSVRERHGLELTLTMLKLWWRRCITFHASDNMRLKLRGGHAYYCSGDWAA